jgi:hypothetical protein
LALVAAPSAAAPKVFVTSTTHSGNLGGLAGADAICQARAAAAALSGTFRAWLSSPTVDAYCRVAGGSSGSKAANCGETALPDGGPYERVDGEPFAPSLQALTGAGAQIWTTLSVTELGILVASPNAFTATTAAGVYAGSGNCTEWTSTSGSTSIGDPLSGPSRWSFVSTAPCAGPQRLYCFETGTGASSGYTEENGALAFVTSTSFTPGGGIAAADALCAARAAAAWLPGSLTFRAWLATPAASAASRFGWTGAYKRVDGRTVATSLADFSDAATNADDPELPSGIWKSELDLGRSTAVYTGSPFEGGLSTTGESCSSWTSPSAGDTALVGLSSSTRGSWTENSLLSCDNSLALYCLSEQPILFWDHFESGALGRWSATAP